MGLGFYRLAMTLILHLVSFVFEASDLRPNLLKLMGRQTSQVYLFSL